MSLLAQLRQQLTAHPEVRHYRLALSGGMDSVVLLHCLSRLRAAGEHWQISAVHVHHNLHADADSWTRFCQQTCQSLDIPCTVLHVDATPILGESPEATARTLRYQALGKLMEPGDALLTAHHQDDQAETLLLQLLRGSGVPGLAAMPGHVPFMAGLLMRPLLDFNRQQLLAYASEQKLEWVEDSSNSDHAYDRNFLRHEILPRLSSRWSGLVKTLSRSALNMADASYCLDEFARQDLLPSTGPQASILLIDKLLMFDDRRIKNLLRLWLRDLGLPVPSRRQLQHVITDVIRARGDSNPCVTWTGAEIRRYRSQIYALPSLASQLPEEELNWDPQNTIDIHGVGRLRLSTSKQGGLTMSLLESKQLRIGFRRGGERVRPALRGHRHDLKKLFQEAGIPPWERDRTPILYLGDEIVCVAGLCDCEDFVARQGQAGLILEWHKRLSETPN